MKEITPKELKGMQNNAEDFVLIDVREESEKLVADIGGNLIPLGTLPNNIPTVPKDRKIIVYCKSGGRSGRATEYLERVACFTNVHNLKGGILAWSDQVDPSVKKY